MGLEEASSQYTSGGSRGDRGLHRGRINWHAPQAKELVESIYVNWHELPVPCTGSTMIVGGETQPCHAAYSNSFADYDSNHDGMVNVQNWVAVTLRLSVTDSTGRLGVERPGDKRRTRPDVDERLPHAADVEW